jgi:hypothetical protein
MTTNEPNGPTYELVNPPFERDLKEMSGKELRAYFDWVLAVIPERMQQLREDDRFRELGPGRLSRLPRHTGPMVCKPS